MTIIRAAESGANHDQRTASTTVVSDQYRIKPGWLRLARWVRVGTNPTQNSPKPSNNIPLLGIHGIEVRCVNEIM